jgi:hypothetical protein
MTTHDIIPVKTWRSKFEEAVIRSLPSNLDERVAEEWIGDQESLRAVIRQALKRGGQGLKADDTVYPLQVDYGLTIEEAVGRGFYDLVDSDITSENFPTEQIGEANVVLEFLQPNREMIETEEVVHQIGKMNYRSVRPRELFALGEVYPFIQINFPVVALCCPSWQDQNGRCFFPALTGRKSKRCLELYLGNFIWSSNYRFAVVSKSARHLNH